MLVKQPVSEGIDVHKFLVHFLYLLFVFFLDFRLGRLQALKLHQKDEIVGLYHALQS